ncbi:uncharacterized protein LOC144127912 isoform X2 [Amblyomma americanum]
MERQQQERWSDQPGTGEEHACDRCERIFPTAERLAVHAKVHRGRPERSLKCPDCCRTFLRIDKLREHQRVHQGGKPHRCDICGKAFTHKQTLVDHLRRHEGMRTMQCDRCPQAFYFHSDLVNHLRRHTGERPFQCRSCQASFAGRSDLLRHERAHDGDRPYHCNVCNRGFARNGALERHMVRHTGKRPFECHLCPNTFTRPYLLEAHLKDHPQPVAFCGIRAEKNCKKAEQERQRRQRVAAAAKATTASSSQRNEACMVSASLLPRDHPVHPSNMHPLVAVENSPSKYSSLASEVEVKGGLSTESLSTEGENLPPDDHLCGAQPEAVCNKFSNPQGDNKILAGSCSLSEVKPEALLSFAFPLVRSQNPRVEDRAELSAELDLMQSLSVCQIVPESLSRHGRRLSAALSFVSTLARHC